MIGETGCGKTRLLRYLCEIQKKAFGVKILICLKVSIILILKVVIAKHRYMVVLMLIEFILRLN